MNKALDQKRPLLARGAIIREAGEDGQPPKMRCSVSSETACRNIIRTRRGWEIGKVTLSHAEGAIDGAWITDGIALRDNHGGELVARGMDCRLEDGKLIAGSIVWGAGERAQTIRADAESGVIRSLSIEADYDPEDVEETGEGEFLVKRWTPLAAAFVPVPADPTVGVNREFLAAAFPSDPAPTPTPAPAAQPAAPQPEQPATIENNLTPAATGASAPAAEAETQPKTERAKMPEKKKAEGTEALVNPAPVVQVADDNNITREELRNFSITRALKAQITHRYDDAKLELEVSRKISRAMGKEPQGVFVPIISRDFTTGDGNGSGLVPTEHLASEFIEVLRKKLVLDRLGVRYLPGLRGKIEIPKQTASTTAYWVAEGVAVTESNPQVGQIELQPHTMGAVTEITRQLIMNSSPVADAIVQMDILEVMAREVQNAVFNGSGTSGQPTGIFNTSGVTSATVASSGNPTWAEIVSCTGVIDKYWEDGGNWVTAPSTFAALRAIVRATYGDRMVADIIGGQKYLADEPAYTTSALSAGKAVYGKFDNVFVGMWGALDMMVDPYTNAAAGTVRVVGLQDIDVAIRHPEAFVITDKFPAGATE